MIKYLLIAVAALSWMIIGFLIGINHMVRKASDGVCIRAEDGEAYLKISESGQKKLLDKSTKLLYIRVVDISTRNNHLL